MLPVPWLCPPTGQSLVSSRVLVSLSTTVRVWAVIKALCACLSFCEKRTVIGMVLDKARGAGGS